MNIKFTADASDIERLFDFQPWCLAWSRDDSWSISVTSLNISLCWTLDRSHSERSRW
jgi:hypothetical protein